MKNLSLPENPTKWRKSAMSEIIQPPPLNKTDAKEPQQRNYAANLHVGERAIDVPFSHLGGWNSASKMQLSHFLTTRTLIKIENPENIQKKCNFKKFHLTKAIGKKSVAWLETYPDWDVYLRDVEENGSHAPPPGKAPRLGEFGNARFHQLQIDLHPSNSQDTEQVHHVLRSRDAICYTEEQSQQTDIVEPMEAVELSHEKSDPEMLLLADNFSPSGSGDSNFNKLPPAEDEEIVNIGLVDFLVALTKCCEHVALDWDAVRAILDVEVGEAHLTARSDGRLHPRKSTDVYALLEVKPFKLKAKPDTTLMQMAIQLLCWMIQEKFCQDHPYFMISGHRECTYLTVATFGQGYPQYILNGIVDNEEECFLTLTCYGPLDMYNMEHVRYFGRLVLSLSITCSEAWKAKLRSSFMEES